MKIQNINGGYLIDTITFQNQIRRTVDTKAYGPILAKIVSILRNLGWILSAGYCCKESLIQIPYGKKNHYLYPSDITSCLQQLGETLPVEISEVNQVTIGFIVSNLKGSKLDPGAGTHEGETPLVAPGAKNSKHYNYSKKEILTPKNVKLLEEFKAKGINFHFDRNVEYEIYKDVFFDLPPGDYFVIHAMVPRFLEMAKTDECQNFFASVRSPFVLFICSNAWQHHMDSVRLIEFWDKDNNPLGKEFHVIPLLCHKDISVQEFNRKMIANFKETLNQEY